MNVNLVLVGVVYFDCNGNLHVVPHQPSREDNVQVAVAVKEDEPDEDQDNVQEAEGTQPSGA